MFPSCCLNDFVLFRTIYYNFILVLAYYTILYQFIRLRANTYDVIQMVRIIVNKSYDFLHSYAKTIL